MATQEHIRGLINRLARLDASEGWSGDLNPAQRAALDYLARANRFSRSPSHAAAFLGITRGTMTQTFKALVRKGYVQENQSHSDKRTISYDLTTTGQQAIATQTVLTNAMANLPAAELNQLETQLGTVLATALHNNQQKPFGICNTCRYFDKRKNGGQCQLLNVALLPAEILQICHEQEPA